MMDPVRICEECGKAVKHSDRPKRAISSFVKMRFCSMLCKNTAFGRSLRKVYPPKTCEYCGGSYTKGKTQGITTYKTQKFCSAGCRAKGQKYNSGPDSPHWKGGRAPRLRDGKYITWSKRVKERDDFTCQICDKRGGDMHSHHVLSWIDHPDSRYDLSNGLTLCVPCHTEEHRKLTFASGEFGEGFKMLIPSEASKEERVETIPQGSTLQVERKRQTRLIAAMI